jgi:hypothetical protein
MSVDAVTFTNHCKVALGVIPSHDEALRQQSQNFCELLRDSPDGWRLCLQYLPIAFEADHATVRFWILECLTTCVYARWGELSNEDRSSLRMAAMFFVQNGCKVEEESCNQLLSFSSI